MAVTVILFLVLQYCFVGLYRFIYTDCHYTTEEEEVVNRTFTHMYQKAMVTGPGEGYLM